MTGGSERRGPCCQVEAATVRLAHVSVAARLASSPCSAPTRSRQRSHRPGPTACARGSPRRRLCPGLRPRSPVSVLFPLCRASARAPWSSCPRFLGPPSRQISAPAGGARRHLRFPRVLAHTARPAPHTLSQDGREFLAGRCGFRAVNTYRGRDAVTAARPRPGRRRPRGEAASGRAALSGAQQHFTPRVQSRVARAAPHTRRACGATGERWPVTSPLSI